MLVSIFLLFMVLLNHKMQQTQSTNTNWRHGVLESVYFRNSYIHVVQRSRNGMERLPRRDCATLWNLIFVCYCLSFTSSSPFCRSQRLTWVKTQSAWWCNHSAVWKTSTKFVTVFPIPIGSLEGTKPTNGHDLPPFQESAIPSLLRRIWRLIENFPISCFYRLTNF